MTNGDDHSEESELERWYNQPGFAAGAGIAGFVAVIIIIYAVVQTSENSTAPSGPVFTPEPLATTSSSSYTSTMTTSSTPPSSSETTTTTTETTGTTADTGTDESTTMTTETTRTRTTTTTTPAVGGGL